MSSRTGLSVVEVGLLRAVELLAGDEIARCSDVLVAAAATDGLGPRYTWPVLVDLGVPWRRHLPLVELLGNAGSIVGDPAADAQYVEVRLSRVGALALAAERGETGPVPLGLVEGSWYADGPVPPFDPERVVGALLAAGADVGLPAMPSGGVVSGDLEGLLAGRAVRLRLSCRIVAVGGDLVITETPMGVAGDEVLQRIAERATDHVRDAHGLPLRSIRRKGSPVVDVEDLTTMRDGVRLVVRLDDGADLRAAKEWLLDVWPVTVERDARLPAPMPELLDRWDRGDGTGLRALADLLTPDVPPTSPLT
ncbi:MAG TPA: hypothetical protein VFL59_06110 [Candidatus Nanopelagicales bacterium]|nr:hypothetical protein [Candidatus Nanopelagicales bacterium]